MCHVVAAINGHQLGANFFQLLKILAQYQFWLGPLGDANDTLLNQEKQFQNHMYGLLYIKLILTQFF